MQHKLELKRDVDHAEAANPGIFSEFIMVFKISHDFLMCNQVYCLSRFLIMMYVHMEPNSYSGSRIYVTYNIDLASLVSFTHDYKSRITHVEVTCGSSIVIIRRECYQIDLNRTIRVQLPMYVLHITDYQRDRLVR